MRTILILSLLFLLTIPVQAQEDTCESAAVESAAVLDVAKEALEDGNIDMAKTMINAAQALLIGCDAGDVVEQPPADTSETVTTDNPDTSEAKSEAPEIPANTATANHSATITPREINTAQSIAFIRFAHTGIDSGPLDIYYGNDTTPIVAGILYGESTEFLPFNAGDRTFRARRSGSGPDGEVLYRMTWNYLANSSWIVTAAGVTETFAFIVEPISVIRNQYNGKSRVRVVNWVSGAPRLSVTSQSGVNFADRIGWVGVQDKLVDAGEYTLQISTAAGENLGEPMTFTFEAEVTHTLYIVGGKDGEPSVRLMPIVSPQDTTRVRFISTRSDTVDIHYRPTNDRIVQSISGDETSDYITLPSGAVTFIAYEPGTGPTGRELASLPLQLRPGRDVDIVLTANTMSVENVILTEK